MARKVICGVYQILNNKNGKFYIGSSNSINQRWYEHRRTLNKGEHFNPILQAAWIKYGSEAFSLIILEEVPVGEVRAREAHFVSTLNPAYNISVVCEGVVAHKHTAESREKIRQSRIGVKHSKKTRALMSKSAKARGIPESTRVKQKEAVTGRPRSPEVREKISEGHRGILPSMETRFKISQSLGKVDRVPTFSLYRGYKLNYH